MNFSFFLSFFFERKKLKMLLPLKARMSGSSKHFRSRIVLFCAESVYSAQDLPKHPSYGLFASVREVVSVLVSTYSKLVDDIDDIVSFMADKKVPFIVRYMSLRQFLDDSNLYAFNKVFQIFNDALDEEDTIPQHLKYNSIVEIDEIKEKVIEKLPPIDRKYKVGDIRFVGWTRDEYTPLFKIEYDIVV